MINATVVIPVYNEDVKTVTTLHDNLKAEGFHVIVVDDGSHMDLPMHVNVISYPGNVGYGYALKQGIQACTTPIVITCDGDGQHEVADVKRLYQTYTLRDDLKMVVGQRWLNGEKPLRWIGRKVLNFLGSIISGHYLVDMNGGLRVIDREIVTRYFPILCDTFSFTTSLTMAMVTDNHKIAYYPIDVKERSHGKSRVKIVRDGLVTLYYILWVGLALRTRRLRACLAGR